MGLSTLLPDFSTGVAPVVAWGNPGRSLCVPLADPEEGLSFGAQGGSLPSQGLGHTQVLKPSSQI